MKPGNTRVVIPVVATCVWLSCSVLSLLSIPLLAMMTDPGGEKAVRAQTLVDSVVAFPVTCLLTVVVAWIAWAIVRKQQWKYATAFLILLACVPMIHAASIVRAFVAW